MLTTASSPADVQQIVLRQPRTPRGQQGRSNLAAPLLPVFYAGEENRFAAFVCGTADNDDSPEFADSLASMGPLLLVGASGTGKSALAVHLAARFLDSLARDFPASPGDVDADGKPGAVTSSSTATSTGNLDSSPLIFMPGVDFARIYSRAVDADDITRFRAELQAASVLVIDDVHLMIDKPAAQDELAARLEARSAASLPTLLTCRRLPTQVPGLRPLLVSRMLPGLTVPIRFPGPEARRCLIMSLAERRDLNLGDEEVELL
ncbi:MAG: DnaA ATPase domain-containing protein, partial [Planctomycetaceae bacterium]